MVDKITNLLESLSEDETIIVLTTFKDDDKDAALTACKGDANVLMAAFHSQMENNEEYRQLMMSMMAAYLAQETEEFMLLKESINMVKNAPTLN